MRILVLALVLVNALFFAWQYWVAGTREAPRVDAYRGVPVLELAPPVTAVHAESPQPVTSAPESRSEPGLCGELGPFENRAAAEAAIERLGLGQAGAVFDDRRQERLMFWVYLEPFPSRQAANSALKQMESVGVTDAFVVNDSDYRNAVSLGLYSTEERAERRLSQISGTGLKPRIKEQDRSSTAVWVSVEFADEEALGAVGVALGTESSVILRKAACGAGGQDDRSDEQA